MGNIVTHRGRVLRTERLSAHLIRVVLGGEGLREFAVGPYSDSYVKLVFRQPGVEYPEPFDVAEIRQTLPRDQWPATRTYTVRAFDPAGPEMTIDFVYHGDSGLAGPWAAAAQPGDELAILGPGARTRRTRAPTGICSSGTRAPCRPSPPPSSSCRRARWPGCSSR